MAAANGRPNRREIDISNLSRLFQIERSDDNEYEISVPYPGPIGTPYEGGYWRIMVTLPRQYPERPPRIRFLNRIFHPNVDYESGELCYVLIRDYWSRRYSTLTYLVQGFIDMVLRVDVLIENGGLLNVDAAAELYRDMDAFDMRVRQNILLYANPPNGGGPPAAGGN